jgi:hypothetical protein
MAVQTAKSTARKEGSDMAKMEVGYFFPHSTTLRTTC